MTAYKLKKGAKIGSLAAEHDSDLSEVFVDTGYLSQLGDASDPVFLLLGRAGSGKTALIKRLIEEYAQEKNVLQIDPDELSMQYLQNSSLREITSWGVNLEIFYKYWWRHVCILSLIRMRYRDDPGVPSGLRSAMGFIDNFWGGAQDQKETKAAAESYLSTYSDKYWVTTDTKIQKIFTEMVGELKKDKKLAGKLGNAQYGLNGAYGTSETNRMRETLDQETVARAQEIVSTFQIDQLNRLVDLVSKHSFDDEQNPYFVVIDDLDKNWMPDDSLYLDLIKSLLLVVRDLNYRLKNAKIIVALREDIYQRVYEWTSPHEAQREKWIDVQTKIRWNREQLVQLVDNRLQKLFRGQYTQKAPSLEDLLPSHGRNGESKDAVEYVLERTLMRPRDVIDFINRSLFDKSSVTRLTRTDLTSAEVGYSAARLDAIRDEWINCYLGLDATFPLLSKLGPRFTPAEIDDMDFLSACVSDTGSKSPWLVRMGECITDEKSGLETAKRELLSAWFTVGLVGIKNPVSHRIELSIDRAFQLHIDSAPERDYVVLKMVRSALGISSQNNTR
jgi:hypothetical protein